MDFSGQRLIEFTLIYIDLHRFTWIYRALQKCFLGFTLVIIPRRELVHKIITANFREGTFYQFSDASAMAVDTQHRIFDHLIIGRILKF